MRMITKAAVLSSVLALAACGGKPPPTDPPPAPSGELVFNEVVAINDGVYIDEYGELDDWIEIVNVSDSPLDLSQFSISDSASGVVPLPAITLDSGQELVVWADDSPEQGDTHLPFKISSSGEVLTLFNSRNEVTDQINVPALVSNQAYARFPSAQGDFAVCRYTTPHKNNGADCQPGAQPEVVDDIRFESFSPADWPRASAPQALGFNELALLPAGFIEVKNFGDSAVDLNDFSLMITSLSADSPLPDWDDGTRIALPALELQPDAVAIIDITATATEDLMEQPYREGAVLLFNNATQVIQEHVAFMHWPENAVLARSTEGLYPWRFCHNQTPNSENTCDPLTERALGDRARGLYTPGDFATLANGSGLANMESVKFVIDLEASNAVHFLSAAHWPLHYTFVREVIDRLPPLNRCDPLEEQEFNQGWSLFSRQNYDNSQTRRYHLGTLSRHTNAGLNAVEYTFGDAITAPQMRDAFYLATGLTSDPLNWVLRPQDAAQVARVRGVEGQLPIVGPNAPFQNITLQALAPGVAYGTLQWIATEELDSALLGPRSIVITDDVPNDIAFVGGLITEAFQTPLAHVNILSQGRGTPNLALPGARQHPDIMPLLGKLVRLEVTPGGYTLAEANLAEAEAFWARGTPNQELLVPRLDRNTDGLVDLNGVGLDSLPAVGAKAAHLAELFNISGAASACGEGAQFDVPEGAFAIPMSYYLQHFSRSGAQTYLEAEMAADLFTRDLDYRRVVLEVVRQMIIEHPLDDTLLAEVESWVQSRFSTERVRFRSSSNTEDLATFNGAGLYDSVGAALGDSDRRIDDAIRTVWASLWNMRAFEERNHASVDQSEIGMAVLVHRAFRNERANGIAIARNILNPTRTDQFYVNSQAGEASVANPAPGVVTEQLVYQWPPRTPTITYHSNSSLQSAPVLADTEVRLLACAMDAIQRHFRPLLDPLQEDRWFSMESEFKFLGEERQFLIKQARPYPMPQLVVANDCREL